MKVSIEKDEMIIRIPMEPEPTPSKTGKNMIVASSHGPHTSEVRVNGKPVIINVNAYVKP